MARPSAIVTAVKTIPIGVRNNPAPSNWGNAGPVAAANLYQRQPPQYGTQQAPFMPRPASIFADGAFGPMPPVQPVPVDNIPFGGEYPDQRLWQYGVGWNLPTPPGTEGLKLASFDQLRTLADKYSVARAAIELRIEEIRGLEWSIELTTDAAKAYRDSPSDMKDFAQRKAKLMRFFMHADPDFWSFDTFLNALLEELFVYDAIALVFRPKYGERIGMKGRGLLGSPLDCLQLVSGPTIRPLIGMHGEHPRPPAPAFQQYLYGVPRSDIPTMARGRDIDDYGLTGAEVNMWDSNMMLYAPYWPKRESPYGTPPIERALLPIISGLQKQEFQLDYFTEGSVPAVYISPGDTNITPTQVRELQDALNAIAGDPAYHMKVMVLPPGSKVEPQRPVDLSDSFDFLVMNQVCMAFDVQPYELGILPNIGGGGSSGPSASAVRFGAQEKRDIKSRTSTKPLLKFLCDMFNLVVQETCGCWDMEFRFEGLVDDEDKQAITDLGVKQVQNGISSIDEIRERLDQAPWGLKETSEPVVFTAQGPIPFSMAPELIRAALMGGANAPGQGTNSGQTAGKKPKTKQPRVRQGGQTKPNGSHPSPVSPHREAPLHAASRAGVGVQSPTPRTGGTTARSSVAGSRKKAVLSELENLRRLLRKDREVIYNWKPRHIDTLVLAKIADDLNSGTLIDVAVDKAVRLSSEYYEWIDDPYGQARERIQEFKPFQAGINVTKAPEFPGWEHDLGLVGRYKQEISQAFHEAEVRGSEIRKKVATGQLPVSRSVFQGMISDEVHKVFSDVMTPLWKAAWKLGYDAGTALVNGSDFEFNPEPATEPGDSPMQSFLDTEGQHWLGEMARTGLANSNARAEVIARTEVARAMNAGVLQAYKELGVTQKHLLVSPDDTCDICVTAKKEGIIPLDSVYPNGGLGGPFHPQCRCVPGPAGVNFIPPQSHIKSDKEDESRVGWLLIRAKDEDGKWRYLLQQRTDGTWGMPGGTAHVGEPGSATAYREASEEIGDLPTLTVVADLGHIDPDGKQVSLYLCESKYFEPKMNGSTPEETAGTGWFRRGEVDDLDLVPKFKDDWDHIIADALDGLKATGKSLGSNVQGEILVNPDQNPQGGGARWPYPHRPSGTSGDPVDDMDDTELPPPENVDPAKYPRRRGRKEPPGRAPDQGGRRWPDTSNGGPSAGGQNVGSRTGVTPSGETFAPTLTMMQRMEVAEDLQKGLQLDEILRGMGMPVTGSVPAVTPQPVSPHSIPPEAFDPAQTVQSEDEETGENILPSVKPPKARKTATDDANLANPNKPGGPSDYSDPNPVNAEHVMNLMRSNFPEDAIQWVMRARWNGPVNIPWERIDKDDIDGWAASHQPEAINRFARDIKAGTGHTNPSVLIQDDNSPKAIIIDGHHRALAHHKLGQPVLAYLGNIDPKDRKAAEETHSKQVHSGSDPQNKGENRPKVSKLSVHYRDGTVARHCGNCVMFHPNGTCDLVKGKILAQDVCDKWETK